APLPPDLWHALAAGSGQRVLERYGMTETVMLTSNPYDGERRPGTVGRPPPPGSGRVRPRPRGGGGGAPREGAGAAGGWGRRPPPRSPRTAGSAPATSGSGLPTGTCRWSAGPPS